MHHVVGIENGLGRGGVSAWARSLARSGFGGKTTLFSYLPDADLRSAVSPGVEVAVISDPLSDGQRPNKERWRHYADFCSSLRAADDLVVLTDVRDLIFQRDPSSWLADHAGGYDLVLSSECETYENEPWNRTNALAVCGREAYELYLAKQPILCAGLVAGRPPALARLCGRIHELTRNPCPSDQVALNVAIRTEVFSEVLVTDWSHAWGVHCAVLYTADAPSEAQSRRERLRPRIAGGLLCNEANVPYVIVHQYDRLPTTSTGRTRT